MDVEQTPLPGIGLRYDVTTAAGRRLGLVLHRDGTAEVVIYAQDDPDVVAESVALRPDEQQALAELLAGPPGQSDPDSRTHHRTWQLTEDTA